MSTAPRLSRYHEIAGARLPKVLFVLTRAIRGVIWSAAIERPELFEAPELADELGEMMLGDLLP